MSLYYDTCKNLTNAVRAVNTEYLRLLILAKSGMVYNELNFW